MTIRPTQLPSGALFPLFLGRVPFKLNQRKTGCSFFPSAAGHLRVPWCPRLGLTTSRTGGSKVRAEFDAHPSRALDVFSLTRACRIHEFARAARELGRPAFFRLGPVLRLAFGETERTPLPFWEAGSPAALYATIRRHPKQNRR